MDKLSEAATAYESLVKQMIEQPDRLVMQVIDEGEGKITFRITVAALDAGRLIGAQGRTARSLRTILGSIGNQVGRRIMLDIVAGE